MNKIVAIIDYIYKEIIKRLIIVSFKVYNAFKIKHRVPRVSNPLFYKSATELAQEIKSRKIRSETLVKLYIDRIKQIQPNLNCVCDQRFEDAIKEAQEVDKLLESNVNLNNLPLLGIPFTCKELLWAKGLNNSTGVVCRKHIKAPDDADVIKLMKKAGAILLCVTNVSELGLWYESANHVYGQTNNIYDTRRQVGGSSGGEGCVISACGSLIGIGSDVGGSIRIPAFFNGIFGHKPTNGLISNKGEHPSDLTEDQDFMLTNGPMCRYSIDLQLVLDVLLAENKNKLKPFDDQIDFRKINFFYMTSINAPFVSGISNDVLKAEMKVIEFIEKMSGKTVKTFQSKYLNQGFFMWLSKMTRGSDKEQVEKLMGDGKYAKNAWFELLKGIFQVSEHTAPTIALSILGKIPVSDKEQDEYMQLLQKLSEEFDELLQSNGVLIFPSFPVVAPYHNQALWTNPIDWITYFGIFNAIGVPVTQAPVGLNKNRIPVGVQLITNRYCDKLTIKLANILEKEFGGWIQA